MDYQLIFQVDLPILVVGWKHSRSGKKKIMEPRHQPNTANMVFQLMGYLIAVTAK